MMNHTVYTLIPLLVLGVLYVIVSLSYIVQFISEKYWGGITTKLYLLLLHSRKWIILHGVIIYFLVKFIDSPITLWCKEYYQIHVYQILDIVNYLAQGWVILVVILTIIMLGQKVFHYNTVVMAKISLISVIYASLVGLVLKLLINRQRPRLDSNPNDFFAVWTNGIKSWHDLFINANSMPSGHTIAIIAAIVPVYLYSKNVGLRFIVIVVAFLVMLARVYTINHWFSDIYCSTLLGIVIGYISFITNKYRLHERH